MQQRDLPLMHLKVIMVLLWNLHPFILWVGLICPKLHKVNPGRGLWLIFLFYLSMSNLSPGPASFLLILMEHICFSLSQLSILLLSKLLSYLVGITATARSRKLLSYYWFCRYPPLPGVFYTLESVGSFESSNGNILILYLKYCKFFLLLLKMEKKIS